MRIGMLDVFVGIVLHAETVADASAEHQRIAVFVEGQLAQERCFIGRKRNLRYRVHLGYSYVRKRGNTTCWARRGPTKLVGFPQREGDTSPTRMARIYAI